MATHKERPTHGFTSGAQHDDKNAALPASTDASALMSAPWEMDPSEQIVAALRSYFLTHTLDFLTGEVYTVH